MSSSPDSHLCERWSGGDDRVSDELFRHLRPPLESFLSSKVLEADLDDLVQKTLIVVLTARPRFHPDAPPERRIVAGVRAFMFGVARKVILAYIRERRAGAAFEPLEVSLASADPSLSRQVAARRHLQILHRALQELPLEQQIAFELREFQGLIYPEIAAALEIAEGTAKSRVRLARAQLTEKFGIKFTRGPS